MRRTYPQRILNYLITREQTSDIGMSIFHRRVAENRFPKVREANKDYDTIHGIVMRTARRMTDKQHLLKRIAPGVFTLSAKGRRVAE